MSAEASSVHGGRLISTPLDASQPQEGEVEGRELLDRREEHAEHAQRHAEGLEERVDGRAAHARVPRAPGRREDLELLPRTRGGLGGRALGRDALHGVR